MPRLAILLDTSGSMNYAVRPGDPTTRRALLRQALGDVLTTMDRAAEATGLQPGGVRLVGCADGLAEDRGVVTTATCHDRWQQIRWAGGTYLMPGWTMLLHDPDQEAVADGAHEDSRIIVITDGEAQDGDQFERALMQHSGPIPVTLLLLGFGEDHERALRRYRRVAEQSDLVRLEALGDRATVEAVARVLLGDIGQGRV